MREEAQTAYNAELDRMTEGTVWVSGGCTSYYIDRNGHNSALWPTYTWPFRQRTREFDVAAYTLGAGASANGAGRDQRGSRPRLIEHGWRSSVLSFAELAQHVLEPGRPLVLQRQHRAGPVRAVALAGHERAFVEPAAGVPEP